MRRIAIIHNCRTRSIPDGSNSKIGEEGGGGVSVISSRLFDHVSYEYIAHLYREGGRNQTDCRFRLAISSRRYVNAENRIRTNYQIDNMKNT